MAEGPDTLARLMSGFALVFSGVALWLNWQKNERDLAALRPQVGISATREGVREWKVRLTVVNPLQVPIVWRTVHAEAPEGLELADAQRVDSIRAAGNDILIDFTSYRHLRGGPITIEPKSSHVWEGYARIHDRYAALPGMTPVLRAGIDGFDQRPNRFRRMAKWIWPSAIRT